MNTAASPNLREGLPTIGSLVRVACFLLSAAVVLLCGASEWQASHAISEHAQKSDPFGYLLGAQQVRRAFATRSLSAFEVDNQQSRGLIENLKRSGIPLDQWEEMVGPPTTHYMRRSGHVAVQYPPGTALGLSILSAGEAVGKFTRLAISVIVALAFAGLAISWYRGTLLGGLLCALSAALALRILTDIGDATFSINVLLAPLSLCVALSGFAGYLSSRGYRTASRFVAFGAGVFAGACVLIRIAAAALMPGIAACLLGRDFFSGRFYKSPLVAWIFGMILTGLVPLALYQHGVAGSWSESTYSRYDRGPVDVRLIPHNIRFYFGADDSACNLTVFCAAIGAAAAVWKFRRVTPPILAAMIVWAGSSLFFLTHYNTMFYYMLPTDFAVVALLAIGVICGAKQGSWQGNTRRWISRVIAGAMALAPTAALAGHGVEAWRHLQMPPAPKKDIVPAISAQLSDPRAWVWAGASAGTLLYYHGKLAMKIQYGSEAARLAAYQHAFDRGDPQFFVKDEPDSPDRMDEIGRYGGLLKLSGTFDGYPYFEIAWRHRPM